MSPKSHLSIKGLRGKSSPLNSATQAQKEAVNRVVEQARSLEPVMVSQNERVLLEIQHAPYVGQETTGTIVIVANGRIIYTVGKNGTLY